MILSMASNVIAYAGITGFDIILYLSRILQKLGRKVLIADYNETMALTYSIPKACGIDTFTEISTYMNIDFTGKAIDEAIIAEYDDILLDCGFGMPPFDISFLTKVIFISDMFEFNLKRLSQTPFYDRLPVKKELLVRDAADIDITADRMLSILKKDIGKVQLLYHDEADYQNAILCHYNKLVRFAGISAMLKKYLLDELVLMVKDISFRQLKAALKKAGRGK